jgi:hypothetical protein
MRRGRQQTQRMPQQQIGSFGGSFETSCTCEGYAMNLLWLLVVILVIFALVGAPQVGIWNHNYGYAPSGIGLVLLVVVIILLFR